MKKAIWVLLLLIGFLILVGIIIIAAKSEVLGEFTKTWGFMLLGYVGFILFAYGWMKLVKKNK
ncbi:MAG: hypothetical protein PHP65_00975 [Bacilli bacterium]|jgi:hypothetical protein|nr:hypothetical protein [Bacilli bacterium]